jgi:hypothetical protein
VDRTIHSTSSSQGRIGSITDRFRILLSDIALRDF